MKAVANLVLLAANCATKRELKQIYGLAIRLGIDTDGVVIGKLMRFAAIAPNGDLLFAHQMFTQMPEPNTFFYNTLIRGYSKSQCPSKSITLFNEMRWNSIYPDEFTFTFLLKSRSRRSMIANHDDDADDEEEVVHGHVLKSGFNSHLFVNNALIHLYASRGRVREAGRVFDEMPERDVVSWSELVVCHLKAAQLDDARRVFNEMPERDVVSWTAMISGYSKVKHSAEALELFEEMKSVGVKPDEVTMVSVISACTHLGDLEYGLSIHHYIDENGLGWMISLCNALIDMYAKCGCIEGSRRVFSRMGRKSLITWNSMISACASHGNVEEAVELFHGMAKSLVRPDGVTFLALLTAYTHKGLVDEGYKLFTSMKRDYRIEAGIEHYGCMVDMLGRAGRLEEAYDMIMNMPIPCNDVVWGALLGACRIYCNVDMGERVVKKLLELKPDEGGYYILLCDIYVAAGQQIEAIKLRRTMEAMGIKKTPGCSNWVGT
ncbi:hypothetical protein Sjap_005812 [Stephania japonica]|uniref:Pentatricopeptide repeat-containing protein n=1 Tax=Stephania japonica TaxID=461633 RepID=A0AAP0K6E6_9MAGN